MLKEISKNNRKKIQVKKIKYFESIKKKYFLSGLLKMRLKLGIYSVIKIWNYNYFGSSKDGKLGINDFRTGKV